MKETVMIVLGGGIDTNGNLLLRGKNRVKKAVEIAQARGVSRVIFSGGTSWHRDYELKDVNEAQIMKTYAIVLGLPESVILTEELSRDTVGNLFFTKAMHLIPNSWHNVLVVSSDYHCKRIEYLCGSTLGDTYSYEVIGSDSGLSKQEQIEREQKEQDKIRFLETETEHTIFNGNDQRIAKMLLEEHPGYVKESGARAWLIENYTDNY